MKDSFFSALYKHAPLGIAVLSENMQIVSINSFLLSMFSLPLKSYKGIRLGNALGCASLERRNDQCGDTPGCAACRLRQGFLRVIGQREPIPAADVRYAFTNGDDAYTKVLRLSMSPVMGAQALRVMISLTDITREKQYEQLLRRKLELEPSPLLNRHDLVRIVTGLLQKGDSDTAVSVGMAALEGLSDNTMPSGLSSGDVIIRFAEIARQCTRRQDIIGNLGDGKFIFVFFGAGVHTAEMIIRRILDTMDAVFHAQCIRGISLSVGFTEMRSGNPSRLSGADLLGTVDNCLASARQRGSMFVSPDYSTLLKKQ